MGIQRCFCSIIRLNRLNDFTRRAFQFSFACPNRWVQTELLNQPQIQWHVMLVLFVRPHKARNQFASTLRVGFITKDLLFQLRGLLRLELILCQDINSVEDIILWSGLLLHGCPKSQIKKTLHLTELIRLIRSQNNT